MLATSDDLCTEDGPGMTSRTSTQEPPFYSTPGIKHQYPYLEAPRFDHYGRTWASWTHTAFMRQAVACATAVATYGGATYAAKEEIRALRSSASHLQGDLLAVDRVPLAPVPEPICAA